MMKKIFIVGLIACSFFVVSISSVVAAPETHTITDTTGDVIDSSGTPVSGKNYLDIKEVSCTRDGKSVELKLVLVNGGKIQNSDIIFYAISLVTSENRYDIYYNNNSCSVSDLEQNEIGDANYSGGGTDTLKVSFNLSSIDEKYIFVYASTYEETEDESYADSVPSYEEIPIVYATMPSIDLMVGKSLDFVADMEGGTPSYTWKWDFGDGNTSNIQNTTHVYAKAGTYKVVVLLTDKNGHADIYYENLDITASSTPDGGDHNNTNNDNGNQGSSSNSGLLLFVAIIAVIVIAGVAIVVYIIRR